MSKLSNRTAALGIMSALALGTLAAAPAYAQSSKVTSRGTCTGHTVSKLKVAHDGRVIEADFEVDSNRVGQLWNIAINDNGVRVFNGSRRTTAPSGSFTASPRLADRAGVDNIVAFAKNAATGETCTARVSI